MIALLRTFSWQELRQHPWRNAAAVLAVMLGVALAFSVHLINASALSEFAQAARTVGGQGDLELRAVQGQFDEALYLQVARHPDVALASPVLEIGSYLQTPTGKRAVRVVGVDALLVWGMSPDLMPLPDLSDRAPASADASALTTASQPPRNARFMLFAPGQVFLNPAAQRLTTSRAQAVSQAVAAAKRHAVAARRGGWHGARQRRGAAGDGHRRGAGTVWQAGPAQPH